MNIHQVSWFRVLGVVGLLFSAGVFATGLGLVVRGSEVAVLFMIVAFGGLGSGFGLWLAGADDD